MVSTSGRYVVSFNGEIYNHRELRITLADKGATFRGHSDTEVLLAAIDHWGIEPAIRATNGMFALAVWDRELAVLSLACDRMGEKPLFYGWMGSTFLFGSELKSLRRHPSFRSEVDPQALALYLRHSCVPAPLSIYQGVRKLLPGSIATIAPDSSREREPVRYWSIAEVAAQGLAQPLLGSPEDIVEQLDAELRRSIGLRMVADVPVGAFLSGGIDSSTVVALMQAQSVIPVRTFTIGFEDKAYNESANAAKVAAYLGTQHVDHRVNSAEALSIIPRLPSMYDEPFGDSSQIPTALVAEIARGHVTVSLSGDGGDELFAGYNRYAWYQSVMRWINRAPVSIRRKAAAAFGRVQPRTWERALRVTSPLLPSRLQSRDPVATVRKALDVLDASSPEEVYVRLTSHWSDLSSLVNGLDAIAEPSTSAFQWETFADPVNAMMYLDQIGFLPNDILTKVDRATMAVGLESCVPMLDHNLVELAWRIPLGCKLRNGTTKWALRQVLASYVPPQLVERPKTGFGLPFVIGSEDHSENGPTIY
jgi:asparagine synthase (glutamine-hydrolysing)